LYFERLFWNQILTWKKKKKHLFTLQLCVAHVRSG
jgi:hypothetical protein